MPKKPKLNEEEEKALARKQRQARVMANDARQRRDGWVGQVEMSYISDDVMNCKLS